MPKLLTTAELDKRLKNTGNWQLNSQKNQISKTFSFKNYLEGVAFANQVASLAEGLNHHPEILIEWRKVSITCSTHSAGGLTALDFDLVENVESISL